MRKIIGISILTLMLNAFSCDNDPCRGIPSLIQENEELSLTFVNMQDENIFLNDFKIDSLIVKENNNIINYDFVENEIIKFKLNSLSYEEIKNDFNKDNSIKLLFKFDSTNVDTLFINYKPVRYEDKCGMTEYEYVQVYYNSKIIKDTKNIDCIFCNYINNAPLIIKR